MNKRMVFTKTAKGLMEATGKTSLLARDLRELLAKVDGKASVAQLASGEKAAEAEVFAAFNKLLDQGFIRELIAGPTTTMAPHSKLVLPDRAGGGEDLDFSAIADKSPAAVPGAKAPPPNFPSLSAVPGGIEQVPKGIQSSAKAELRAEADAMAQELAAVLAKAQEEEAVDKSKTVAPEAKAQPDVRAPAIKREPAPPAAEDRDRVRKQIEDEIRRSEEAEAKIARERARRDAEARVRKEIEDKARAEAEALARQEAEKKAKADAEAKAAREAEGRIRKEVEERVRREAEEHRRREEQDRLRAEKEARPPARVPERRPARAEARPVATPKASRKRMPARTGRVSFWFFVIVVAGGLGVLQYLPLDADRYAQLASERFQLPVTIRSARFSLLPTPTVTFENVTVARVPIASVKAVPEIMSMFDERPAFKSVEFSGMTMSPESLGSVLWRRPGKRGATVWEIDVHDFRLALPGTALPTLDLTASYTRDGQIKEVRLASANRKLTASIVPQQGNRAAIEINADSLVPFGLPFRLTDFSAKTTATERELVINDFDARLLGGIMKGNGRLRWSDGWSFDGDLELRTGEAAQIAPEAFVAGRVAGRASYSVRSQDPAKLFAGSHIEGNFSVENAVMGNIDLPRMVQTGIFATGTTQFSEFSGHASIETGRVALRQLRIAAGPLSATGNIDVDAARDLSGKLNADLKIGTSNFTGTFNVGGTLARPQLTR